MNPTVSSQSYTQKASVRHALEEEYPKISKDEALMSQQLLYPLSNLVSIESRNQESEQNILRA